MTIATRSVKRAMLVPSLRLRPGAANLTPRQVGVMTSGYGHARGHWPAVPRARRPICCARVAAAHPEREAYVHGDKRVTYAWLDRAADGFAATLLDRGVAPGDVVCLLLPSSIKFAACYLGALRAGAITSAINLRLGASEQRASSSAPSPRSPSSATASSIPTGVDAGT